MNQSDVANASETAIASELTMTSEAAMQNLPGPDGMADASACPYLHDGKASATPAAAKPSTWLIRLATFLNRPGLVWHRLPGKWLGYLNLFVQRSALQQANLFDTGLVKPANKTVPPPDAATLAGRTADGSWNNLRCPYTGMAGTRLGRNVPVASTWPDQATLYSPHPLEVADILLKRKPKAAVPKRPDRKISDPKPSLNMLAVAWIQFMVHDWFTHGDTDQACLDIPEQNGYPAMRVRRTAEDPTRTREEKDRPPTYVDRQTQWWDGSQIYGSSDKRLQHLRTGTGGMLRLGDDGLLHYEAESWKPGFDPAMKKEQSGVTDNWWIGLSMFHTLFTHEHNAVCKALAKKYPKEATDDWLFNKARLVTSALMAKIHVLEWTPSTGAHPSLKLGVKLAWGGLLGRWFGTDFLLRTQRLRTWPAWLMRLIHRWEMLHPLLTGIPGSPALDHGVPFSMTEEFVAAYRMHPLLPDEFEFRSAADGRLLSTCALDGVLGDRVRDLAVGIGMTDLFYSFGLLRPGELRLHNYPKGLRDLPRPPSAGVDAGSGETIDLAVVDIMRDRERGLPRYNDFREKMHLPRVATFKDLNAEDADKLKEVYGHIDNVDLMVGMLAETPPRGFAYSDTAFRTFILMASRRLEADRFFTTNYDEDTYTSLGMQWVENNCLKSVLQRHHPELHDIIDRHDDMFSRWTETVIGAC